jgi:hypothetical protein
VSGLCRNCNAGRPWRSFCRGLDAGEMTMSDRKGRNENGPYHSLGDWVRPWNMYGKGGMVGGRGRFHSRGCSRSAHK